jgi:hypothetical protein
MQGGQAQLPAPRAAIWLPWVFQPASDENIYHQSALEIINLFIYHSVLLIGLLSWSSGKLPLRLAR